MLYDLAGDSLDRNRVLSSLISWSDQKKIKPSAGEEAAIGSMMADAGILDAKLLKSKWSPEFKARVAESLEARGKGNAETRQVILAQNKSTGPSWERIVREEIDKAVKKERAIDFHGKNGEQKFQARVAMIRNLGMTVERYSQGASIELRAQMLNQLKESHDQLASQIMSSPIPPGLVPDQEARIRESLAEMAKPFQERAVELGTMMASEAGKAQAAGTDTVATQMSSAVPAPVEVSSERVQLISKMHENPRDTMVLASLRDSYRSSKQERLELYFEGRIQQLQKETQ
ncbi:MAG: hypothetical protein EOO38_14930 [Cytophagaceae bacterium]|nr:MAG: hypothetical protein EOO38_14930 [Cytophagaceae bacterium]